MRVSFSVSPDHGRSARLDTQLDALGGEIRDRRKHARRLAGYVRTQTRRNIRKQETVEGAPFAARRDKRDKRAMLTGLAKTLAIIPRGPDGGVVVSWKNPRDARIAWRHQHGVGEDWGPQRAARAYGVPDYKARCTRRQAKALLREGFRLPVPGKGGGRATRRVSVMWLEKHFTLGQAGLVLRLMRTGKPKGEQEWRDTVPERAALGVTAAEADKMCERLAKNVLGSVPR